MRTFRDESGKTSFFSVVKLSMCYLRFRTIAARFRVPKGDYPRRKTERAIPMLSVRNRPCSQSMFIPSSRVSRTHTERFRRGRKRRQREYEKTHKYTSAAYENKTMRVSWRKREYEQEDRPRRGANG